MGKSLNKATLIGHAGRDAEIRYTGNGMPVASFSIATSESWKDKNTGQMQERTEWHNIVAWSRLAEICGEYVKKGTRLYIEGRIQNRSYDDKDGNKRYISEIIANDMILLDSRRGGDSDQSFGNGGFNTRAAAGASASAAPMQMPDFEHAGAEDDLPF